MTARLIFCLLSLCLVLVLQPMSVAMRTRPVEVKLGYLPHPQILKAIVADQGPLVAEFATVKVLFYYGTIVQNFIQKIIIRPEFFNMYKTLQTASQLDPYNKDIYHFTQAAFTWEVGRVREVNHLLEHGMQYRTWDYWLPFYAGFNCAYFLKDYDRGAYFMRKAAEISGDPLFTKLAARYFYESNQTSMGLDFLETMIKTSKDEAVKRTYQFRKDALLAVTLLEKALGHFKEQVGRPAYNLEELVGRGIIEAIPLDPYDGKFYVDESGRVRTTSKFASPDLR